MIIAVDGPAASGKGTLAEGLAHHFGLPHLDTGLLYRAVGQEVADFVDAPDFADRARAAAEALDTSKLDPTALGGAAAAVLASKVAALQPVRDALFAHQRAFAHQAGGAVLDGRDIGTAIAPDAEVKLFVIADAAARADRRAAQLEARGQTVDRARLRAEIEERDARDAAAPHGGFRPADGAHLLDTTELDIEAALRAAVAIVEQVMARKER